MFTVFNKDALYELKSGAQFHTSVANSEFKEGLETYIAEKIEGSGGSTGEYFGDLEEWESIQEGNNSHVIRPAYYADEIPPFDITITMVNEYGMAAKFSLLGVEILNEGSGMSIDDITTEKACTFVARGITPLTPVNPTFKDVSNKNR